MPITLDCYCPGDSAVAVCQLVELRLLATIFSDAQSATVAFHETVGGGGTGVSASGGSSASLDQTISGASLASWVANWGTVNVTLFAQSTFSLSNMLTTATWKIIQHYECVDGEGRVAHVYRNAFPDDLDDAQCVDGVIQIIGTAGGSGGSIWMRHTSPLGCTDVALQVGNFSPDIDPPLVGTGGGFANFCLCASGGSGSYIYALVSGELPDGLTLNSDTGCIEGTVTGVSASSSVITFRATDRETGDTADVTCAFVPGCGCQDIGNSFY
jgi:hypothetical protein